MFVFFVVLACRSPLLSFVLRVTVSFPVTLCRSFSISFVYAVSTVLVTGEAGRDVSTATWNIGEVVITATRNRLFASLWYPFHRLAYSFNPLTRNAAHR